MLFLLAAWAGHKYGRNRALLQNAWPNSTRVMFAVEIHGAAVCFGPYNTQKQRLSSVLRLLRPIRSALHIQIPESNTQGHSASCGTDQPGVKHTAVKLAWNSRKLDSLFKANSDICNFVFQVQQFINSYSERPLWTKKPGTINAA